MPDIEEIVEESRPVDLERGMEDPSSTLARDGDPRVATLADKVIKKFSDLTFRSSRKSFSILRVPQHLTATAGEDYEPKLVSIGPLHRGKDKLLPMENVKLKYLHDLLNRDKKKNTVGNYFEEILKCVQKAREYYSEKIDLSDEEFAETLVVDGCFIIEYMAKTSVDEERDLFPFSAAMGDMSGLDRDLLLLENQIPLFILAALFKVTEIPFKGSKPLLLLDLLLRFLGVRLSRGKKPPELNEAHHLLHLQHMCFDLDLGEEIPLHCCRRLVMFIQRMSERVFSFLFFGLFYLIFCCRSPDYRARAKIMPTPLMIPSATELHAAGITFKRKVFSKNAEYCYTKVSFERGTLEIPVMVVDDTTGYRLRNFIALEQCSEDFGGHITSYSSFMDNIINTASDVTALQNCGILESMLGCEAEVAALFNGLGKGVIVNDDHLYADLCKDVAAYCGFPHRKWRASLVHNYFSKPWAIFSVLGAFVLLGLTAAQTYFAAKALYADNKKNR